MKVLATGLKIQAEGKEREEFPAGTPLTKLPAHAKKAAKAADILMDVLVEEPEEEEASEE